MFDALRSSSEGEESDDEESSEESGGVRVGGEAKRDDGAKDEWRAGRVVDAARGRLALAAGDRLVFHGAVCARVVAGALRVFGARLTAESGDAHLHSPAWDARCLLALEAADDDDAPCEVELCASPARFLTATDASDAPGELLGVRGFYPVRPGGAFAPITSPPEWARLAAALSASAVVMLVGPRNAGKSTLCRFLVNRWLAGGCTRVAVLDLDVGQAELAPPGVAALSLVSRPLLGPPHTHLRSPDAAVFVGDTTVSAQPGEFVRGARRLVERYRAAHAGAGVPLVVNTPGWVTGLGRRLLEQVAVAVSPTHMVEVSEAAHGLAAALLGAQAAAQTLIVSLPRAAPPPPPSAAAPAAAAVAVNKAALRAVRLATYLLGGLDGVVPRAFSLARAAERLALRATHTLPFGAAAAFVLSLSAAPAEYLLVLNRSLVGLCECPAVPPRGRDGILRVLDRAPAADACLCLGVGFVEAVDMRARAFRIVAPLSEAVFRRVNLLLKGPMPVPAALFDAGDGGAPYLDWTRGVGSAAMRSRRNVLRR